MGVNISTDPLRKIGMVKELDKWILHELKRKSVWHFEVLDAASEI